MWTHWGFNWFFLPNPFFAIYLNFQQQKSLKNQCLPHLSCENYEINSIKSTMPRAFQQHHECPQIPIQFSVLILYSFHWENGSTINSFHTVAPNSLEPSKCTPPHQEISKNIKSVREIKCHGLGDFSMTIKQNKLLSFKDRCCT
jgi:hypothetical protein